MPPEVEEKEEELEEKEEKEESEEDSRESEDSEKGKKKPKESSKDDDEDTILARKLYRTLNEGGDASKAVVLQLARQLGLDIKDTTRRGKEERSDEIKSIFEEELGDEYAFLAKRFEKALNRYIDEKVNPSIARLSSETLQNKLDSAIESVLDDNEVEEDEDREKMISKMNRVAKSFQYVKGADIEEYVEGLFTIASKSGKKSRNKNKQIRQNLEDGDIPSSDIPELQIRKGPEKPSLEQAVADAARGIKYK